jgi:hypothetical protein
MLDRMRFQTTEEAVNAILKLLREEAQRLSIEPRIEKREKKSNSNELMIALKKDGQTFRITLSWVRDEHVAGSILGHGYIEKSWHLKLRPENPAAIPVTPPFVWKLKPNDETKQKGSHPPIVTEDWLRQEIRKKLAIPQ